MQRIPSAVPYPELVSSGVSKSGTFKGLVKVGASNLSMSVIRVHLKKIMAGGVSGQPEKTLDTPLFCT